MTHRHYASVIITLNTRLSGWLKSQFLHEKDAVSALKNTLASINNHRHSFAAYDYNQGKV